MSSKNCTFAENRKYMIYVITYNINTSIRDYTLLYESIKSVCLSYYHAQESTWFIACDERKDIRLMTDFLVKTLFPGDTIFIAELTDRTMVDGWITKDFWTWYKDNIR